MSLSLTSILLDDEAAIVAKAVADLFAAKAGCDTIKPAAEPQDTSPFVRIRAAIADFQERVTGGAWPDYANKAAVRGIAKAANAPPELVRYILRYPKCSFGRTE